MQCVNKSLPEFKELADKLGENLAESIVVQNDYRIPSEDEAVKFLRGTKVAQFKHAVDYLENTTSSSVDDLVDNMGHVVSKKDNFLYIVKGSKLNEKPAPLAKQEIQDANTKFLTEINNQYPGLISLEDNSKLGENKSADTQDFFSDVVTGKSDKFKPQKSFSPILDFTSEEDKFKSVYDKYEGKFDQHIATSIPTFRETQIKVGTALTEMLPEGSLIYDIGGSEGGFAKAITESTGGGIKTINLDPNPDMQTVHEAKPVEGSKFVREAFLEGFENDGIKYDRHIPEQKADVVHESMVFQFISPEREQFINEIKQNYLKPDGITLLEEKVVPSTEAEWKKNEEIKDSYKRQFYPQEAITQKAEQVLVGMKTNQTAESDLVNVLNKHFEIVKPYWDAGNFKGYVASDSAEKVDTFLSKVGGEIKSDYSSTSEKINTPKNLDNSKVEVSQDVLNSIVDTNKEKIKIPEIDENKDNPPKEDFQKVSKYEQDAFTREQKKNFSLQNVIGMLSSKFGIKFNMINDESLNWAGKYGKEGITINEAHVTPDTPFHEIFHPFMDIIKEEQPELYKSLVDDLKSTEEGKTELERVQKEYPELSPEEQETEALVSRLGKLSADKALESKPLYKKFLDWIKTKLAQIGIGAKYFRPDMSMREFADLILDPSFVHNLNKQNQLSDNAERFSKISDETQFNNVMDNVIAKLESYVSIPSKNKTDETQKFFSKQMLADFKANRQDLEGIDRFVLSALGQTKRISEDFEKFKEQYESKKVKSRDDILQMAQKLSNIEDNIVLYNDLRPLINSVSKLFPDEANNWGTLSKHLARQDSLIDDYNEYGLDAISERVLPFMQKGINQAVASGKRDLVVSKDTYKKVSDTMRSNGVTDDRIIIRQAVKQQIKNDLLIARQDTDFMTSLLGGTLNTKDPITQAIGLALTDEMQKANREALDVKEKIAQVLRKIVGNKVFATDADHKKFYEKYLRKAKVWTYKGLKADGTEEYAYEEHAAFHEEYKWDDFYNAKREFLEKLGPAPSREDEAKFKAWKAKKDDWYDKNVIVNDDGNGNIKYTPVDSYRNADFQHLLQNDELFKTLYTTYKSANDKTGGQGLKFGIVPQVSKGENLFRDLRTAKSFKEGLSKTAEHARNYFGSKEQVYLAQNIEGNERKTVPINHVRLLEDKDLSYNLADGVSKYNASATKYAAMRHIEPEVLLLRNFINGNAYLGIDKRRAFQNNANGTKKLSRGAKELIPVEAKRSNEMLNNFINDVVYGESDDRQVVKLWNSKFVVYKKDDISNNGKPLKQRIGNFEDVRQMVGKPDLNYSDLKLGRETEINGHVVKLAQEGANLSLSKFGRQSTFLTAVQAIALNVNSLVSTLGIGNIGNFVEASGGKYFNLKEWGGAMKEYTKSLLSGGLLQDTYSERQTEISQLLKHYGAFQGQMTDELGKELTPGVANKLFTRSKLFMFMNASYHQIESTGMLAMLRNQKVQTNDGQTIRLRDAWVKDGDGNISLRKDIKWTQQDDDNMRNTIQGVNKDLNGNFSSLDKAKLQRVWYGRMIMMFRKHIYNAFKARYAGEQVNYEKGTVTEGYYRTFFNGLVDELKEYQLNGKFRQLTDQEKYARNKVGTDLATISALILGFKMTKDDDDKNEWNDYAALWSRRLISETVQYAPVVGWADLAKMIKDPVASYNTIEKYTDALSQLATAPDEEYEKSGPGYTRGELKWKVKMAKIMPLYRQWVNIQDPTDLEKYYQLNVHSWLDKKSKK